MSSHQHQSSLSYELYIKGLCEVLDSGRKVVYIIAVQESLLTACAMEPILRVSHFLVTADTGFIVDASICRIYNLDHFSLKFENLDVLV